MENERSLDRLCGALAYAVGVDAPTCAAPAEETLCAYVDTVLGDRKADRLFLYNPDAIARWVFDKYRPLFSRVEEQMALAVPFCTVMPSVTPVCFATMYTGAQPAVHGIRGYVKPVLAIDTLFDALIRSGKRPAIVSTVGDSISRIFLGREMDYYLLDTVEQVNAKAAELIRADIYDAIVVYNGNYDATMHRYGPESREALQELRDNVRSFDAFCGLVRTCWRQHRTLIGFAMDHGCHEIDGACGSHGLDMEEDLRILHFYGICDGETAS